MSFIRSAVAGSLVFGIAFFAGCEPERSGPIDAPMNAPSMTSLSISPATVNTDTMLIGPERLPDDVLSVPVRVIAAAHATSQLSFGIAASTVDGSPVPISGSLNDNGMSPDAVAGDGSYTGTLTLTFLRSVTGTVRISVGATDADGLRSSTRTEQLTVLRLNRPPVLSSLVADSTVSLSGDATTLLIHVTASDPDGLPDVRRVWFNSFKPDGSPSGGNPFQLFDDGNSGGISGDQTAGDGVYSITVRFDGAGLGMYRFEFHADDRSQAESNTIIHTITVVP